MPVRVADSAEHCAAAHAVARSHRRIDRFEAGQPAIVMPDRDDATIHHPADELDDPWRR